MSELSESWPGVEDTRILVLMLSGTLLQNIWDINIWRKGQMFWFMVLICGHLAHLRPVARWGEHESQEAKSIPVLAALYTFSIQCIL